MEWLMNGAELLVGMLHAYDVRCVFGVPGDTNVAFYAALEALRDGPRHILTRDERSAGYMADAYARITNRPGVVEVPSGGGPMYALPAVAEANESSVPLLLLTFDMPLAGEGRGVISQLFDCARLLEPVTKLSVQIKAAAKIPETIRRAFRVATTGRPGAVQLVIPEDILHQEVRPAEVSMHVEEACRQAPAYAPSASTVDVRRLQSLMTRAARPLIVAGGGVNCSRAGPALTAVAERYRIPVVSTMTGQNAIDDYHELAIGIVGDNGFHPHANRAMEEADLLVYFGCRIGSVVSIGWTFPALRADRQIAQVDICPEFLANNTVNTLSINADARAVLEELSELPMPIDRRNDPGWVPLLNGWRRRFWDQAATDLARQSARRPLSAQLIIDALGRRLTGRHFLLADPGTSTSYLNRFLRLQNRESRVLIPRAFGSLGYALPAVVGAWCADPEARPVGLFGDGSLGMSVGELETLVRLNVPAVLLSFNNSSFGWIKAMHRARRMEPVSVDFTPQDACAIAQAFGLRALRVETPEELESALDAAFAHSGPVFLDLVVESVADVVPPVYRWLRHAGIDPLAVGGQPLVRPDTRPEPPRGE
jgi:acetolactate synthase-1/2/3 large subunit